MKNIIICADHDIGYEVVKYIVNTKSKIFNILKIFTTDTNNNGFWKKISSLDYCEYTIFSSNELFLQDTANMKNIDYIFLISWKYLLSKEVINKAKVGVINLHYSLLPKYRGVYPVNNAIINSEQLTGITYHWVNEHIDKGSIIVQKSIPIKLLDTTDTLLSKLNTLALQIFKDIWEGTVYLNNSNDIVVETSTKYFSKKYFESTNKLDMSKKYTVLELINLIKGKTFQDKSSLYIEDKDGTKVFISINLIKDKI